MGQIETLQSHDKVSEISVLQVYKGVRQRGLRIWNLPYVFYFWWKGGILLHIGKPKFSIMVVVFTLPVPIHISLIVNSAFKGFAINCLLKRSCKCVVKPESYLPSFPGNWLQ